MNDPYYVYKGKFPEEIIERLLSYGYHYDFLSTIFIEIGTNRSKMITKILNSSATVLENRIYFRNQIDQNDSIEMLAFIIHEITHIEQWRTYKWFLLQYSYEYIIYSAKYILARIKGEKMGQNWIHDQISFECEAMKIEKDVIKSYYSKKI